MIVNWWLLGHFQAARLYYLAQEVIKAWESGQNLKQFEKCTSNIVHALGLHGPSKDVKLALIDIVGGENYVVLFAFSLAHTHT